MGIALIGAIATSVEAIEPFTARANIRFESESLPGTVQLVEVIPDDGSAALRLTVSEVQMGWLPTWTFRLEGPPEWLFPSAGERGVTDLANVRPQADRAYELMLSYHPDTGALAVSIRDVDEQRTVAARGFQIAPYGGSLVVEAGAPLIDGSGGSAVLEAFTVDRVFEPLGARWRVVQREAGGERFTATSRIDRRRETAVELEVPWTKLTGEFALVVNGNEIAEPFVHAADRPGILIVPIAAEALSPGHATFDLVYKDGGVARVLDSRNTDVGQLEIRLSPLTFDEERGVLSGAIHVQADGVVESLPLEVDAVFTRPVLEEGRFNELVVGRETAFRNNLLLGAKEQSFSFDLEVPAYTDAPGLDLLWISVDVPDIQGVRTLVSRPEMVPLVRDGGAWRLLDRRDPRTVRQSEVVFMRANSADGRYVPVVEPFLEYGASRASWNYTTNPDYIKRVQNLGIHYHGTMFLSAVGYEGRGTAAPGRAKNFDGAIFTAPSKVKWAQTPYWGDPADAKFIEEALRAVERWAALGVDGLQLDDPFPGTTGFEWGGGFSEASLARFRDFLRERLSAVELDALGIADLEAFDYREYLRERGIVDNASYVNQKDRIPLTPYFREFLESADLQLLAAIRELADAHGMALALNAARPFSRRIHFNVVPLMDFFNNELHFDFSRGTPSFTNMVEYKTAEALGIPMVVMPGGPDNYSQLRDERPDVIRGRIAEAYAFGHLYTVPYDMWAFSPDMEDLRYFGEAERFADLYRFIRERSDLFDGFESVGPWGVLVNVDDHLLNRHSGISMYLLRENVPFRLLVAADWLTEEDFVQKFQADFEEILVLTRREELDPRVQRALDRVEGNVAIHYGPALPEGRPVVATENGEVIDGRTLVVVPRINRSEQGRGVLHLLNRRYDLGAARFETLSNVEIAIDEALFGEVIVGAIVHQPGDVSRELEVRRVGERVVLSVPSVDLWSVVELKLEQSN